jgi:hypothetical protein
MISASVPPAVAAGSTAIKVRGSRASIEVSIILRRNVARRLRAAFSVRGRSAEKFSMCGAGRMGSSQPWQRHEGWQKSDRSKIKFFGGDESEDAIQHAGSRQLRQDPAKDACVWNRKRPQIFR